MFGFLGGRRKELAAEVERLIDEHVDQAAARFSRAPADGTSGRMRVLSVAAGATLVVVACSPRQSVPDLRNEAALPKCEVAPALVRLGSIAGDAAQLFNGVEDATLMPDGRVVVLDRGSDEVRLFDPEGRHLTTLGGTGEGPGELADPIELEALAADSVAVWDWSLNRVSVFPTDRGAPRTVRLDPPIANPTGHFGLLRDDGLFVLGSHDVRPMGRGSNDGQQLLQLLAYSDDGQLTDTLHTLPYGRRLWVDEASRQIGSPRFEARGVFDVSTTGVYVSTGGEPEVFRLAIGGALDLVSRWEPPDRRVRSGDVEAARQAHITSASRPDLQARARRYWDMLPIADQFPAVAGIQADGERIWVRRYPRPGTTERRWWLFEPDNRFVCSTTFADGFQALDFRDDLVVGVIRDDLGVEYVEVRSVGLP